MFSYRENGIIEHGGRQHGDKRRMKVALNTSHSRSVDSMDSVDFVGPAHWNRPCPLCPQSPLSPHSLISDCELATTDCRSGDSCCTALRLVRHGGSARRESTSHHARARAVR